MRIACIAILAVAGVGANGPMELSAQRQTEPAVIAESLVGSDSFALYCASCHGSGGRGDGPVAAALVTRPSDLTRLSANNNGAYPRDAVRAFVTGAGRVPAAHGTTEMPIWGPMFRAFESDARVRVRIDNLVAHIEKLQAPSSGGGSTGAQAFRTYCASCHGISAKGDGVLAGELRRRPPDLTRFTRQNGGVFPEERLRTIIDGRGIRAHGSAEMPVWGDAFRDGSNGLTSSQVQERIRAILDYLAAVQERPAE
jgi:mono/diheme cytochrome c family protein